MNFNSASLPVQKVARSLIIGLRRWKATNSRMIACYSSLDANSLRSTSQASSHVVCRRAVLAAAAAALAVALERVEAAHAMSRGPTDNEADELPNFYARWPYVKPSDILPWVKANAAPGDADAVLAALDEWAR